mgnify:CR=1 FL=1
MIISITETLLSFAFATNKYLPFDFVLEDLNIIVEQDGPQHFKQISNWQMPELTKINEIYNNSFKHLNILLTELLHKFPGSTTNNSSSSQSSAMDPQTYHGSNASKESNPSKETADLLSKHISESNRNIQNTLNEEYEPAYPSQIGISPPSYENLLAKDISAHRYYFPMWHKAVELRRKRFLDLFFVFSHSELRTKS